MRRTQELPRNQQEGLHADGAAETLEAEAKIKQHKQQIDAETAKKVVDTQAQQRQAEVNLQRPKRRPRPRSSLANVHLTWLSVTAA